MRGLTKRQPSVVSYIVCWPRGEAALGLRHDPGRAAHRLDAAGRERSPSPSWTARAALVDRLEAGGAEPVDGHARHLRRQAGEQHRHPRDVAVVLAGLVGGAHVDVVDPLGRRRCARPRRSCARRGRPGARSRARRRSRPSGCAPRRSRKPPPRPGIGPPPPYPGRVGFILGTMRSSCSSSACFFLIGHFYPGSGAELLDWKPTRSSEPRCSWRSTTSSRCSTRRTRCGVAGERRGATTKSCATRWSPRSASGCGPQPLRGVGGAALARALIVGCGCRGRLGAAASRTVGRCAGPAAGRCLAVIEAAGIEAAIADPVRPGTILDLVGDVAVVHWLLGSASGEPESSRPSTARGSSAP